HSGAGFAGVRRWPSGRSPNPLFCGGDVMSLSESLVTSDYVVTDGFFGEPYVDVDEWREKPAPHRHVHGGFAGTDTRFTFYFPAAEGYEGRMYHPLEGANGGHEDSFGNEHGNLLGGLDM